LQIVTNPIVVLSLLGFVVNIATPGQNPLPPVLVSVR
jgi:hypothetical protein